MTKLEKLRSRYIQDPVPTRLGGLAANLARVASFSKHAGHQEVVSSILQESKWFIEWTAVELNIQQTAELVTLQVQMALWSLQAPDQWQDESWRLALASESERWSQRVLDMSGLLK
jgi:hypothetical protein